MGLKLTQTNFSSGELDPKMAMRHDVGAFANGAKVLRNVRLLNQGGVTRRPGTEYLATLPADSRLIPFEFSADERYVLALSNARVDIFDLAGTLLQTITGAPWTSAILRELTYAQAADVLILCHQSMQTQVIRRTSATTFTRSAFAFAESVNGNKVYQPYYKFEPDDVTLSCSSTSGSTTLTTSASYFVASHVGSRVRWYDTEITIDAVTNGTTATGTIKGTLEGTYMIDPFRTKEGTLKIEVTHVDHGMTTGTVLTISGANNIAGIGNNNINGNRTITVIDDNRYSFTAGGTTNATSSTDGGGPNVTFTGNNIATRVWSEQTFSTVNGWPGAVTFHEGRLWFGGSASQPDGVWGSKIFQFFNFDVGEGLENESIQITIGSDDISSIRHLVSNRHLQIFTATAEFFIPKQNQTATTPANCIVLRQTPYGSSTLTPMPFDGATVFLQSTKKAVREFLFTDVEQAYNAPSLSILADHLLQDPIDMTVAYGTSKSGEQYMYLANADGSLPVFHSARSEKLAGWTMWTTGTASLSGAFKSVLTLGERVYVVAQRGSAFFLERFFASDLDGTLDSAQSFTSGTAKTAWTLGSRFANKTVSVVSGNYYLGDYTANSSGAITLTTAVTTITVGYNYLVTVQTLPLHVQMQDGSYTGRYKRISRVILGLDSTLSVGVQNNNFILRQVRDDFGTQPDPFTGKTDFYLLGYQRDATVTVTQTEPLPMRLLGMALEVSI